MHAFPPHGKHERSKLIKLYDVSAKIELHGTLCQLNVAVIFLLLLFKTGRGRPTLRLCAGRGSVTRRGFPGDITTVASAGRVTEAFAGTEP